jgi:hypothetical protein
VEETTDALGTLQLIMELGSLLGPQHVHRNVTIA